MKFHGIIPLLQKVYPNEDWSMYLNNSAGIFNVVVGSFVLFAVL